MNQQAIDYINNKIEKYSKMVEVSKKVYEWNESKFTFHWWQSYWYEQWKLSAYEDIKDELQALWDGWIPFEIPPEKEWTYLTYWDDLNNNVWPRVMNYVNWSFECWDWVECPTHWMPLQLPPKQ